MSPFATKITPTSAAIVMMAFSATGCDDAHDEASIRDADAPTSECFSLPVQAYHAGDGCLEYLQKNPSFKHKRHAGDDFCAATGTPVHATGDGVVVFARAHGTCPNWGHLIAIEHKLPNDSRVVTLYGHVVPSVAEGATVMQGDAIGTIGHYSCWADHVHFAVALRDWGASVGTYPGWVFGYFPSNDSPTSPYTEPVNFVLDHQCP